MTKTFQAIQLAKHPIWASPWRSFHNRRGRRRRLAFRLWPGHFV